MTDEEPTPSPRRAPMLATLLSTRSSPATTDAELRERMRTLDDLERKWGFGVAGLTIAISAIFIPSLLHNTKVTNTATPVKGKCPTGYTPTDAAKSCVQHLIDHPSQFVLKFSLILACGLILLWAVWASKRTLVIFMSFLSGLAAGTIGLLFIFYGGWLLVRSWRLQRYGAVEGKEVRKIATERSAARREAKKAAPAAESAAKAPTPSKRYTPKGKPKKR